MKILFLIILFIFGTLFGSFASVIIYRLKSGESGILTGRSHCPKCNNILGALELIPIFSWLKNLGKCKYCKSKISSIYPFLEISTGILFGLIGYFLTDINLIISLNINEIIKLFFWLVIAFVSIIYIFYDILFLEIHDGVMLFGITFSAMFLTLQGFGIINIIPYFQNNSNLIQNISGLFILIFSIFLMYIIIFKEMKFRYDFLLLFIIGILIYSFLSYFGLRIYDNIFINSLVGILIIFGFLFIQIAISGGAWMGGGDLRIAIFIGILLGYNFSIEALFLTYIIGSIIGISIIIYQKIENGIKHKTITHIPFGPFLALGFFFSIFFSISITQIIQLIPNL